MIKSAIRAVLDGSEILGIFVHERFGISIGKVILFFNIILFAITALVFSVEVAMYSILTFLITARVIDLIIEGFEDYVGLMIVSAKASDIESALVNKVGVGLLLIKAHRDTEIEVNKITIASYTLLSIELI